MSSGAGGRGAGARGRRSSGAGCAQDLLPGRGRPSPGAGIARAPSGRVPPRRGVPAVSSRGCALPWAPRTCISGVAVTRGSRDFGRRRRRRRESGQGGEGGRSRGTVTHPPVPAVSLPRCLAGQGYRGSIILVPAALPSARSRLFSRVGHQGPERCCPAELPQWDGAGAARPLLPARGQRRSLRAWREAVREWPGAALTASLPVREPLYSPGAGSCLRGGGFAVGSAELIPSLSGRRSCPRSRARAVSAPLFLWELAYTQF